MTHLLVLFNWIAGKLADWLLAPIAILPGWLSATAVAAVTGIFMLLIFKYTSNQRAVKHARNQIKANVLALSLFKDSVLVSMRSQGRILRNAGHLLLLAIVPMLIMTLPMCLLLSQLALWYQARPLHVGEEAVLTVRLADGNGNQMPEVEFARLLPWNWRRDQCVCRTNASSAGIFGLGMPDIINSTSKWPARRSRRNWPSATNSCRSACAGRRGTGRRLWCIHASHLSGQNRWSSRLILITHSDRPGPVEPATG